MAPTASALVRIGIPALALAVLTLVAWAIARLSRPRDAASFALGAAAWLAYSAFLGLSGVLARFDQPPRLALLMLPTILLPLLLGFSRLGDVLAWAPLSWLVGFQAFRLPLELVMHRAASEGTMPVQMSFAGANFDILTGASAVLVAGLATFGRAPRWLLILWNTLGCVLLAAIVGVAIASLPAIAAFGRSPERLNTWIAYFPYVWLPAGLVSSALFGHVLLWRRLLSPSFRTKT